jgi:hypothetical protein
LPASEAGRGAGGVRMLALAAAVAAGAAAGFAVSAQLPDLPDASGAGAGQAARPVRESLAPGDPRSLFRARNLRRVVAAVRRHAGAQATLASLRVEPGLANFEVLEGSRRETLLAGPSGRLQSLGTDAAPTGSTRDEFRFRRLDPAAPQRLMALLRRRAGLDPAKLNYIVADVDIISERPELLAYPKGGGSVHYEATIRGTHPVEYGRGRPRPL